MQSGPAAIRQKKVIVVGGGIVGTFQAYFQILFAKMRNEIVKVVVLEKNKDHSETTASNMFPSYTPDEALAVVPLGEDLIRMLGILFSDPEGIRVDDVNVLEDEETKRFIDSVRSLPLEEVEQRKQAMLQLGTLSMELWQWLYDQADDELKQIFNESNFHPCNDKEGYRIDLISDIPNAQTKAQNMKNTYESLGFTHCKIMTPAEVEARDPHLADFCRANSEEDPEEKGERRWKNHTSAIYRPGGCIDTQVFLPKFYKYLEKIAGTYTNENGHIKNLFKIKFNNKVTGVKVDENNRMHGLVINHEKVKQNKYEYKETEYVLCPGEAVGTIEKLGLKEPPHAGFAGASLTLDFRIPDNLIEKYETLMQFREVHKKGIVLAWQARERNGNIFVGVAGTKALYGSKTPQPNEAFCKNRTLVQLNIVNSVIPEIVSLAFGDGRDTTGKSLTEDDLKFLVNKGVAKPWVGTRAVVSDQSFSVGLNHNEKGPIPNSISATHGGSGGVSGTPAMVVASQWIFNKSLVQQLAPKVFANKDRVAAVEKALELGGLDRKPKSPGVRS